MINSTPIYFQTHEDPNGVLCVYECGRKVPFDIRRVFTISAKEGDVRGDHAHRKCTQLLVCVSGQVRVTCDDGTAVTQCLLDDMGTGLLIPPGVWAKEEYVVNDAVLMVLCDQGYDSDDYIRDYNEFKIFLESRKSR